MFSYLEKLNGSLPQAPAIDLHVEGVEQEDLSSLISLLTSSGDVIVRLNDDGQIVAIQGEPLFEDMHEALTGGAFTSVAAEEHAQVVRDLLVRAAGAAHSVAARVQLNRMSKISWAEIRVMRLSGTAPGYIAVLRNVSDTVGSEEKYHHVATHDLLTGLPNRLMMTGQVRAAVAKGVPFGLLVIDVTEFKKVNTLAGLATGDALLKSVGQRILKVVRVGDVLARLNGDEFAVLIRNVADADTVRGLSQRVLVALNSPFEHKGKSIHLGARVGAALFPEHGDTAETLIENASVALHRAKSTGSAQGLLFVPGAPRVPGQSIELEAAMYQAMQLGEFHLDYQPLVNAKTRKIQGFEALMRWTRASGERVSPADFIPMAERNGLINLLGGWALKVACMDIVRLQESLGYPVYISVNVSPIQFKSDKLHESVKAALDLSGIPGSQLLLEITEGALMSEPARSEEILNRLVEQGVKVAIDDFGTGYSSLAYLKKFPISILKVDRAFIKDLPNSEKDEAICKAVISLASHLNMKTVAEGVETEEQLTLLSEFGCNIIQGYYTGRPASRLQLCQNIAAQTS